MSSTGKIIAIIGAPRSGKSFLAQQIANHYKTKVFLEGDEGDFPKRIEEDIRLNIRPLERILWFRNKVIFDYQKALKRKARNETVVLDTCWLDTRPYNDVLVRGFERKILNDLFKTDINLLPWPDTVIFLKNSKQQTRDFQYTGDRNFDEGDTFFNEQILPLIAAYKKYFSSKEVKSKIITIDRANLDFSKEQDLTKIITCIEKRMQK